MWLTLIADAAPAATSNVDGIVQIIQAIGAVLVAVIPIAVAAYKHIRAGQTETALAIVVAALQHQSPADKTELISFIQEVAKKGGVEDRILGPLVDQVKQFLDPSQANPKNANVSAAIEALTATLIERKSNSSNAKGV